MLRTDQVETLSEVAALPDVSEDDTSTRLEADDTIDVYAQALGEVNESDEAKRRWRTFRRIAGWLIFLGLSFGGVVYMMNLAAGING